ncbi:ABC-2 family transporter protein [Streptomyces sp. NPDC052020]|uniref:ABC transporter permease n=1 Tax=Streptomyces sp. NPDC052020 TaxID=3155677 RepID=UPI0034467C64
MRLLHLRRAWRIAGISPLAEWHQPVRLTFTAARTAVQMTLVVCLWRALYDGTPSRAGLESDQAVTYAVLALLISQRAGLDRYLRRDTLAQHVQEGTVAYWFLRPLAARRYHLLRGLGDQAYCTCWLLVGLLAGLGLDVVQPPASAAAGAFAACSFLLGQFLLYQFTLAVDLVCFWTMVNHNALLSYQFLQNLLSGALAPLWFFPQWFQTMTSWLPFQGVINIPLSLYVGRIPSGEAWAHLAVQAAWCVLLLLATRGLWLLADRKIAVQGG